MTVHFYDTSALVKRYVVESGTLTVRSWLESASNTSVISALTLVEIISTFYRREKEGDLTSKAASAPELDFLAHVERQYFVIPISRTTFPKARELVKRQRLRTLDAVQLACAVAASPLLDHKIVFLSADNRLLDAASAEGLQVGNLNNFP